MADMNEVYDAMRVANSKGDSDTVRKLADYIQSQQSHEGMTHNLSANNNPQTIQGVMLNTLGGGFKGASNIGTTIINPLDSSAREQRRKDITAGLVDLGVNPESPEYKLGTIGAEIAGTSGVGGFLGKGATLGGRLIPTIAPTAAKFATALESGGLANLAPETKAGAPFLQNLGNAAIRIGGGAATGAGTGVLINPSEIGWPAAFGAAIPSVGVPAAAITKGLYKGGANIVNQIPGTGGINRLSNRLINLAAGNKPEVIAAMENAPAGITAGQAGVGVAPAEFSALDTLSGKILPNERDAIMLAQKSAQQAKLQAIAGGANQTEAMQASQDAFKEATDKFVPQMNTELGAANVAGTTGVKLQNEADRLAQAAVNKVKDVRRFQPAEQRAIDLGKKLLADKEIPQAPVRYTYQGEPGGLADRAAQMVETSAAGSLPLGEGARFAQFRADSIAAHGLKPLDVSTINNNLDNIINTPGIRMNEDTMAVINGLKERFKKASDLGGGIPDAHDIYEIRKSGIGEIVDKITGRKNPDVSDKLTAKLTTELKPYIDDAIVKAGGTEWKNVLDEYAQGMHSIDQQKMAAKAMKMSPDELIALSKGNKPEAVQEVFGNKNFNLAEQMDGKEKNILEVASELARNKELERQSALGMPSLSKNVSVQAMKPLEVHGMLNRPVSLYNSLMDVVSGNANTKVMENVASIMNNPKSVAQALKSAQTPSQMSNIMGAMQKYRQAINSGIISATSPTSYSSH